MSVEIIVRPQLEKSETTRTIMYLVAILRFKSEAIESPDCSRNVGLQQVEYDSCGGL